MKFKRLKALRKDNSLLQKDIAEIINVNQKTYSRYETGEHEIPVQVLMFLARYYKTSTDYLLGMTDEKQAYPEPKK